MTTQEAIKAFGSRRKLAEALGISPQAVWSWGETPPKLRLYQIKEKLAERQQ